MTPEAYASYRQAIGHQVFCDGENWWYCLGGRIYTPVPYHRPVAGSEDAIRRLLRLPDVLGVRYPVINGPGSEGYLIVCDNASYDVGALHQKARNQTRRGLEACTIRPMSFKEAADLGLPLYHSTLERQGRNRSVTAAYWERNCKAAAQTPDMEVWGAFVGDRLAALMMAAQIDDCQNILLHISRSDLLPYYPNNAILFTFTQAMFTRPGVRLISYGRQALEGTPSLDEFKFRMGYRRYRLDERVQLHPLLRPVATQFGRALTQALAERFPTSDALRKACGILRIERQSRGVW